MQFFGNRSFTFRAQAGSLSRQARFFVAAELVTLLLNYGVFSWLVPRVHGIAPELVSFAGTFVVFVTFAYPMRRLVIFKLPGSTGRAPGRVNGALGFGPVCRRRRAARPTVSGAGGRERPKIPRLCPSQCENDACSPD